MSISDELHLIERRLHGDLHRVGVLLKGRPVRLLVGPYAGRCGSISHVTYSGDEFKALVYVERVDGTGVLNSDGASRSYWSLSALEGWDQP